ncbi:hypothetical protein ACFV3R_15390 [Streptomyces sp. NPDC059740]|uniref:hypothetical protein n=1 Tax=Streptomyces sp. NPDC059740 TaxID=3346926 RepID=UPI00365FC44A
MTRRSPLRVPVSLAVASAAVVSLGGCMTVHGEREMIPAVSKGEAAKALKHYVTQYNAVNRTFDAKSDFSWETGPLAEQDRAQTKINHAKYPDGPPHFVPMTLSNAHFTVPRQAGWPKFFVADAISNYGNTPHWYLLFTRDDVKSPWKAAYLEGIAKNTPGPQFKTDADGYAQTVPRRPGDDAKVRTSPSDLAGTYTDYLTTQKGTDFAPGPATTGLLQSRRRLNSVPGQNLQWDDQASKFPPMALRTKNGGALVFFATDLHQKTTLPPTSMVNPAADAKALLTNPAKKSNAIMLTKVTQQMAMVPPKGSQNRIQVLSHLPQLISATML